MKNLILFLTLLTFCALANAQKINQLEEAKVGFAPLDAKILREGNTSSFKVVEAYAGEFVKNPISFMNKNFNIQNFISEGNYDQNDTYEVTFRCAKGSLFANFDGEGNLQRTFQKFKNVPLPIEISRAVLRDYKGWTITKNKVVARGKGNYLDKSTYRLKLEKENEKQKIKLDGKTEGIAGFVSN
ncbi:hypothetical protein [Autumnicola musiva]|uniref:GLPGLI family protein n=1 Tax=Autumnicola musiva TaxID=3075589 RepID=A0ABU3D506_9FLAO|nr:hypothetical protein [Zunongwangia sp. F117]MDT0676615.1 hypothetical protein [Zunongwangia sp. F117]